MSKAPTVLALDLATTTGWAISRPAGICSGVRKLPSDPVDRVRKAENWLSYRLIGVDRVVVERAGFAHQNARTVAAQLLAELKKAAAAEGCELIEVSPSAWKKHATGSGAAGKQAVLDAVNERHGLALQSHDEADARALLAYAMDVLG